MREPNPGDWTAWGRPYARAQGWPRGAPSMYDGRSPRRIPRKV